MSPHVKLSLVLAPALAGPPLAALALLEMGRPSQAASVLAAHCAASIGLLPFFARLALHLCAFKELGRVVARVAGLRAGSLPAPFDLPVEKEDEHILVRLKRGLNWMFHVLGDREKRLLWRLEESGQAVRLLEDLSRTDPLTGLGNRRGFDEALEAVHGQPGFILLIDCDKFKAVNDTHGHQAGDEVLSMLAGVVRDCVRAGMDQAFRLGGDEFAVLLACRHEQAMDVAGRIGERFRAVNGRGCTLSMGLAPLGYPEDGGARSATAALARADAALYRAKAGGGDAVSRA